MPAEKPAATDSFPPLDDLLRRTAAEIRQCRAVVVQLEDAVHALIDSAGSRASTGPLADLQAIDLLDQRLNDLALWTEALAAASAGLRPGLGAEALGEGLLLAEMRRALAGLAPGQAAVTGHAEVF